MSKTTTELPFTELVERVRQVGRGESTNDLSRIRGSVNDVYCRELPHVDDWSFLVQSSALTTDQEYKTGTVSVNTQATACTFSSDAVLDATMTGRKVKFSGNPNVYDFTFSNTTAGTISPPLSGKTNLTNVSYVIMQPVYALASDFDRFPKNGGLLLQQGGEYEAIPEKPIQDYYDEYTPSTTTPSFCRLVEAGTDGLQRVELVPPPKDPMVIRYEYLRRLVPLRESTNGTVTVDAGSTQATFHAGARLTEASTGWYLRVNAFGTGEDSEWYRVLALSAANSTATLQAAFGTTAATSAGYTLCAAPAMPVKMHQAVLWGAVRYLMADQNDPTYQFFDARYQGVISEARRLYKTRTYPTHVDSILEEWDYRR